MRVKGGFTNRRRHKKVLKRAKGFDNRRSTNLALAREALLHADTYAYRDRRNRKRDMRALWLQRANAAIRDNGSTWSTFAGKLKKAGVTINRKMLSELAIQAPESFDAFVKELAK
jgi:large subunit ribosomal protein L20